MTTRISARMVMQQEVYELFHDYWNVFTALNNYVSVLRRSTTLSEADREVVDELSRLLSTLEQRTEAIRARVLVIIS